MLITPIPNRAHSRHYRSSLTFNGSNQYLTRTFPDAGNQDAWTFFAWIKKTHANGGTLFSMGNFSVTNAAQIVHAADGTLDFINFSSGGSVISRRTTTSTTLVPLNTWVAITAVYDSANGTANDRLRLYVGNTRITSFSATTNPGSGVDSYINAATAHSIGRVLSGGSSVNHFTGNMSDIYFVDGAALDASSFLDADGRPKRYTGALGTNGFWLTFGKPNSTTTLGQDDGTGAITFGEGSNDWTLNNMTTDNHSIDVP